MMRITKLIAQQHAANEAANATLKRCALRRLERDKHRMPRRKFVRKYLQLDPTKGPGVAAIIAVENRED